MPDCLRVAIVGGGPRGLFALDCLSTTARQTQDRPLAVTLFEPCESVGAGAVYALNQPSYLLMNFVAGMIDAWDRSFATNTHRPTLMDWLRDAYPAHADPQAYLPRALVGEYLAYCFATLCADLPANLSLQIEPLFVSRVVRSGPVWQVEDSHGAAGFDQVLIVTGHQRWQQASDLLPLSAYPVERLSQADSALAQRLRCKGFGLTFIDAALALTIGRGGFFVAAADGRLGYQASGREPACIQPVSRSGRPMLAKPDAGVIPMDAYRAQVVEDLSVALGQRQVPIEDFEADVWPLFCRAADAFIDIEPGLTARWFEAWRSRSIDGNEAGAILRQSWQVATGRAPPDAPVALALVWRAVYPQLVTLVSHGGLLATAIAGFRGVAVEMERIAFGPAAVNIERLLTLVGVGLVELSQLGRGGAPATFVIDATLPAPNRFDSDGPLPGLFDNERLALTPYGTVDIDTAGRPHRVGQIQPVNGLAIVGRMTELSVLGNDTLSRTLHPTLARWASQVCGADDQTVAPSAGFNQKISVA